MLFPFSRNYYYGFRLGDPLIVINSPLYSYLYVLAFLYLTDNQNQNGWFEM